MTPELTALTLAALLQVLQFAAYSVTAQMQVGTKRRSAHATRRCNSPARRVACSGR